MKRYLLGFLLVFLGALGASFHDIKPAIAACPSPLTGRDASGTSQNFGVTVDGSGNCYGNVGIVDGANAGNKATVTGGNALKVDGSAVTQPVSGTVTANQGGTWTVQQGSPPWPVSQSGSWSFTCVSGCTGGGGGGTTELVNSAGQQLGANLPGQANVPLQINQVLGLGAPPAFPPAQQIWDGQHYLSLVPPNGSAQQAQTAIVVRNPDAGNIADAIYGGSGSATENSVLKGLYAAVTSSIPAGSNVIGGVTQSGSWTFQCTSGCTGTGGTNLANTAGQPVGQVLPGANNIPFFVNQAQTSLTPTSLLPSTGLWDGKNYASFAPSNSAPQAWQPALVVTLSPNSPSTGGGNVNVTQFGSSNVVTGTGASGSGIPRVTVSNDSNILATQSGSWTVAATQSGTWTVQPGNTQNTTPWLTSIVGSGNIASVNASNQLAVNCANCSGSGVSQQDATGFVLGSGNFAPVGGAYVAAPTPLASGQAGVAMLTAGRILEVNNRDSSGQEVGASLRGQANIPLGVNQVQTALSTPFFPATGLWDGKNYASFAPPGGSVIASQPALVTALSPNTPLPAGTNTLGAVTGSGTFTVGGTVTANQGGAWTVQQGTPPWTVNPGTAANWGIGATGSGVPANAVLEGMSQGGNTTALTGTSGNLNVNLAGNSFGTLTVAGTVTANQGSPPWSVSQSGTWTVQQGTPPWNIVNYDTGGRQLGSSLAGVNNVPFVTTQAQISLAQAPLLPSQGLWDGKNYASFTPPSGSAIATQPALVTTLSPNSPLPAGTNTLGGVTQIGTWTVQQGGAPWSVSQSGSPWGVSIQQGGNTANVNGSNQLLVNCGNCSGSGVSQVDNTGFTFGTTSMAPIGGVYSATPTPLTNGDAGAVLLTQGRILEDNRRDSSGQELGASLTGKYSPPVQVNIASQVTNNTLVKQTDNYGQLRTASMFTDGTQYAALTVPNRPPRAADSAIVVSPSPVPSLQCPFIQAINASGTATIITGTAGKFLHICSYKVIAAAALSFTLNEGTGTTCGTGTTALDGGGSGSIALAANGGFQTGQGAGQVTIPMQVRGDNLCLQVSASSVSGYINYGIFN